MSTEDLRLECLKLADTTFNRPHTVHEIVARADAYFQFVTGNRLQDIFTRYKDALMAESTTEA